MFFWSLTFCLQATEKVALLLVFLAAVFAFVPPKYILLVVFVEFYTREMPYRKESSDRWIRRIREWWDRIPAAPVQLVKPVHESKKNESKKKKWYCLTRVNYNFIPAKVDIIHLLFFLLSILQVWILFVFGSKLVYSLTSSMLPPYIKLELDWKFCTASCGFILTCTDF